MANDYRNRGMFGYEGEGYMQGGGRDLDREYGGRGDEERGGGYGIWGGMGRTDYDRDAQGGRGRYDRGAYGGGYSGPNRAYGTDAGYRGGGYLGGDYPGGTDYGDRTYRGQSFPEGGTRRPSYRGRGPKNYQRSDDRIREDVCERLEMDDYVDASDLEVSVNGGTVVLSGSINERNAKRRAADIAESVSGVRDVENRIRIAHEDSSSS
jgi:osmotically-inducible protein OsmY